MTTINSQLPFLPTIGWVGGVGLWVTLLLSSCSTSTDLVHNLEEFNAAVAAAEPGAVIRLAAGEWADTELEFKGRGTEEAPIVLTVETKGGVVLTGQSNLTLSGEYLVVEGLVFKEGYTPTSEVIAFRTSPEELCSHCRVTECVIDNFSNPERFESDSWVGIYGKYNRFDHNQLEGKNNQGVTLAVRLNSEASQQNHHRIDHNYFGYRETLGSNGGETLRIGTSHYSLTNSNTVVENNYFYRCSGEVEIISSKSCQNTFRNNTFYECQGTLTMRHGNETLVENNFFFGNRVPNTGGIRIINESQQVVNNYIEGLTGYRFRSALTIMNGVPNSPANRYVPVINSAAIGNVILDSDHIQFCVGSDEERSVPPQSTRLLDNVIAHGERDELFSVFDDISGISFENNILSPNLLPLTATGFEHRELVFREGPNGVRIPVGTSAGEAIAAAAENMATSENTGVDWYPRNTKGATFGTGRIIPVATGTNSILAAYQESEPGDILQLTEAGEYLMTKSIDLKHPITIAAAPDLVSSPKISFQKTTLFNIADGGALALQGLTISGEQCRDMPGNALVRTSRYSMRQNYKLFIEDCTIEDLTVNRGFNVLTVYRSTFADSIVLRNSNFRNISGAILPLNKEIEDLGIYNAEYVVIENCEFENVAGAAVDLYRGGRDESTFGPILEINDSAFSQVGTGSRNKTNAAIALHGVQVTAVNNASFAESAPLRIHHIVGEPITSISHSHFPQAGAIIVNDDNILLEEVTYGSQ
ncbi:MAG: polysaccharide lyase 6 family protein [Bacteroidota bacterium]